MIASEPTVRGEFLDEAEQHLVLTVGDVDAEPDVTLRADRADRTVEVGYSADIFDSLSYDPWGLVREAVEGHLEATLPHPEVTASWGRKDETVWQAFMPYIGDEYSDQIGGCDG